MQHKLEKYCIPKETRIENTCPTKYIRHIFVDNPDLYGLELKQSIIDNFNISDKRGCLRGGIRIPFYQKELNALFEDLSETYGTHEIHYEVADVEHYDSLLIQVIPVIMARSRFGLVLKVALNRLLVKSTISCQYDRESALEFTIFIIPISRFCLPDGETLKNRSPAGVFQGKELLHHAHIQHLAETPGAGDEGYRIAAFPPLRDERRLINIKQMVLCYMTQILMPDAHCSCHTATSCTWMFRNPGSNFWHILCCKKLNIFSEGSLLLKSTS